MSSIIKNNFLPVDISKYPSVSSSNKNEAKPAGALEGSEVKVINSTHTHSADQAGLTPKQKKMIALASTIAGVGLILAAIGGLAIAAGYLSGTAITSTVSVKALAGASAAMFVFGSLFLINSLRYFSKFPMNDKQPSKKDEVLNPEKHTSSPAKSLASTLAKGLDKIPYPLKSHSSPSSDEEKPVIMLENRPITRLKNEQFL